MYISTHCLAIFYVNLNVIFRPLSFKMAVAPQPSGFSDQIRVLSNTFMNSVFEQSNNCFAGVTVLVSVKSKVKRVRRVG